MISDYLLQWSAANHDDVASQLTYYETKPLAIQNQASHLTFSLMSPEGRAAGAPNPPLISPRHNQLAPWNSYGVCGGESGLINEKTQSGWRMIV
jgi:hypothetical protein